MIYLILATLSSMLVSVLMRMSEKHCRGGMGMLAANYLVCSGLSLAFSGSFDLFPAENSLIAALVMGGINGILYLAGFVLLQWNIRTNGVVLSATFMKLGVLAPTLLSILAFGETPGAAQMIGILAAVSAILLIQGKDKQEIGSIGGLALLLLVGGGGDAMSKVFEELGSSASRLIFSFIPS